MIVVAARRMEMVSGGAQQDQIKFATAQVDVDLQRRDADCDPRQALLGKSLRPQLEARRRSGTLPGAIRINLKGRSKPGERKDDN
jgi:hypothetical protein